MLRIVLSLCHSWPHTRELGDNSVKLSISQFPREGGPTKQIAVVIDMWSRWTTVGAYANVYSSKPPEVGNQYTYGGTRGSRQDIRNYTLAQL